MKKNNWKKLSIGASLLLTVMSVTPVMAKEHTPPPTPNPPPASQTTDLSKAVANYTDDNVAYSAFLTNVRNLTLPSNTNGSIGNDISVIHGSNIVGSSTAVYIEGTSQSSTVFGFHGSTAKNPTDYKVAGSTFTYDKAGADDNYLQNTGVSLSGKSDDVTVKGVSFIYNSGSSNNWIDSSNKVLEGIIGNGAIVANTKDSSISGRSDIYNSGQNNLIYTAGASVTNASNSNVLGTSLVINTGNNVKWNSSGVTIANK